MVAQKGSCYIDSNMRISEYRISQHDKITLTFTLRGGGGGIFYYVVDHSLLEPTFDHSVSDDGTKFYRGGKRYYRPYGWKRYALKVKDTYEDNKWLGEPGHRVRSSDGEWPVAYSTGDTMEVEAARASQGIGLSWCRGVLFTPSFDLAAKHAERFEHEGKQYKFVFQCRVNTEHLIVFNVGMKEFWVQPCKRFIRIIIRII